MTSTESPQTNSTSQNTGLKIITILLLIFVPIVGLIVMHVTKLWSKTVRLVITLVALIYMVVCVIIAVAFSAIFLNLVNNDNSSSSDNPSFVDTFFASGQQKVQLTNLGPVEISVPKGWTNEWVASDDEFGYEFKTGTGTETIRITTLEDDFPENAKAFEELLKLVYQDYKTVEPINLDNGYGVRYTLNENGEEIEGFSYVITVTDGGDRVLCESNGGYTYNFSDSMDACESIKKVS